MTKERKLFISPDAEEQALKTIIGSAPPLGPSTAAPKTETAAAEFSPWDAPPLVPTPSVEEAVEPDAPKRFGDAMKEKFDAAGELKRDRPMRKVSRTSKEEAAAPEAKVESSSALSISYIAVDDIDPCPRNPRKDLGDIGALAETVKQHGILSPLLLRPMGNRFEVVAGHRRLAAAKKVGLEEVPAEVRALDDVHVLELQVVENVQREQLNPLEEGDAYVQLQAAGFSVEQIAERTGRSKSAVYQRMKLTNLCPEAKDAFLDGRLPFLVGVALARRPHRLQAERLKTDLGFVRGKQPNLNGELNARDALEQLQRSEPSLKDAPWNLRDAELDPGAGPCFSCPKNSRNMPRELFEDVEGEGARGAGLCTDTACWAGKLKLHFAAVAKTLPESTKIFDGDSAKEIMPYGQLSANSPWVRAEDKPFEDPKKQTWRALVGDVEVPQALLKGPRGEPILLYDRKQAFAAAAENGARWAKKVTQLAEASKEEAQKSRAQLKKATEKASRVRDTVLQALVEMTSKLRKAPAPTVLLRTLAASVIGGQVDAEQEEVAELFGIEPAKLERWLANSATERDLFAFIFIAHQGPAWRDEAYINGAYPDGFPETIAALGLDLKAIEGGVRAREVAAANPKKKTKEKR